MYAFSELDNGNFNAEIDLKYTHRLKKHIHEYAGHVPVRTGVIAKLLGKDKGDLVYWYETYTEEYVESKKCGKRKRELFCQTREDQLGRIQESFT